MSEGEKIPVLEEVFVAHRRQLHRAAMKVLGNRERAEDVVQDAYLKILDAGIVFEVRQPLAYVFQVVRNLAIDAHRRGALEMGLFVAEEQGAYESVSVDTPEARASSRQELQAVAHALSALPERTRRAFELYRFGGVTQRDIGMELGVSATLVNFMVRDALDCCRAALASASVATA
ncbi:MAG: RNA polymerase factor sigma-70 [Rhodocyclaceae bacterium]